MEKTLLHTSDMGQRAAPKMDGGSPSDPAVLEIENYGVAKHICP